MHETLLTALNTGGGVIRLRDHPELRHRIRHAREKGQLRAVLRGILAAHAAASTFEVRVRALFRADPDAVLVGRSAEVFHGWRDPAPDEPVHAASARLQGDRPGFVLTRRRIDPDEITVREAPTGLLRATSPALTTLDLARGGGSARTIDDALRRAGRTDGVLTALHACLRGQKGRRGNRRLRQLLHDSRDEPWSEAERSGHRALRDGGVRGWVANHRIACSSGRLAVGDLAFPELMLVIEIDGWEFHRSHEAFEHDRLRDLDLSLDGWQVVRVPARSLLDDPELFAAIVAALVRLRRTLLGRQH